MIELVILTKLSRYLILQDEQRIGGPVQDTIVF